MTILIKVKVIIATYRSPALGARLSVIIDAQTNRVCVLLAHLKHCISA